MLWNSCLEVRNHLKPRPEGPHLTPRGSTLGMFGMGGKSAAVKRTGIRIFQPPNALAEAHLRSPKPEKARLRARKPSVSTTFRPFNLPFASFPVPTSS